MIDSAPANDREDPWLPRPGTPTPGARHDPPDPRPQAIAWERALRVVALETAQAGGVSRCRTRRSNPRGRAVLKALDKTLRGHAPAHEGA